MKEARSELTADADERENPPDFDALEPAEELVRGDRTREHFLDAVLELSSPQTAEEVATLAGHGVDAAREYLSWFERMGIVVQVTDSPATYERNQAYLNWRRVQRLRASHTTEELLSGLQRETERAESLAAQFDSPSPDDVALSAHAAESGRSVEAVWEDVSAWKTARRRIEMLEQALRADSSDAGDPLTA